MDVKFLIFLTLITFVVAANINRIRRKQKREADEQYFFLESDQPEKPPEVNAESCAPFVKLSILSLSSSRNSLQYKHAEADSLVKQGHPVEPESWK